MELLGWDLLDLLCRPHNGTLNAEITISAYDIADRVVNYRVMRDDQTLRDRVGSQRGFFRVLCFGVGMSSSLVDLLMREAAGSVSDGK